MFILLAALTGIPSSSQSPRQLPQSFPLWNFDEKDHTCRAKGRLQDKEYCESKLMDEIVAQGKAAIPILISQLTDPRESKEPIYDYWNQMTSGDIAYFILSDLFTDSDGMTFNMPGLDILEGNCQSGREECWRALLKKHGRTFIQDRWRKAWRKNRSRIYWDGEARCFRLSPKT
jgi:hypothetical protein